MPLFISFVAPAKESVLHANVPHSLCTHTTRWPSNVLIVFLKRLADFLKNRIICTIPMLTNIGFLHRNSKNGIFYQMLQILHKTLEIQPRIYSLQCFDRRTQNLFLVSGNTILHAQCMEDECVLCWSNNGFGQQRPQS